MTAYSQEMMFMKILKHNYNVSTTSAREKLEIKNTHSKLLLQLVSHPFSPGCG